MLKDATQSASRALTRLTDTAADALDGFSDRASKSFAPLAGTAAKGGGLALDRFGDLAKGASGRAIDYARDVPERARSNWGLLAGVAAVGFLAGLIAVPAKKAALQGVENLTGDWAALLTAEHRLVEGLFETALATEPRETLKRANLLEHIAWALGKHALEEENAVYPTLRAHAGADEVEHLFHDHMEIKVLLHQLDALDKDDPRWIVTLRTLRDLVVKHAREEETEVFPRFQQRMTKEENAALTKRMNREGFKLA